LVKESTSNKQSLQQVLKKDLLWSTDHSEVLAPRGLDLLATILSKDVKWQWQTAKEIIDNFVDSGSLHWVPNEDTSNELANLSQKLKQKDYREHTFRDILHRHQGVDLIINKNRTYEVTWWNAEAPIEDDTFTDGKHWIPDSKCGFLSISGDFRASRRCILLSTLGWQNNADWTQ
jgi:hypothetical protein